MSKLIEKLYRNIKKQGNCWIWQKGKDIDGYGVFTSVKYEERRAHRMSYKLFKGNIPKGMFILHSCHNPSCCNPEHLRIGTPAENSRDCVLAGRSTKGFKNGRCKLTKQEFDYIMNQKGKISGRKLADKVSINKSQIYKIWRGEHKYE